MDEFSCGVCFSKDNILFEIFDSKYDIPFLNMIKLILGVEINESEVSDFYICCDCSERLKLCYEFRMMLVKSDIMHFMSCTERLKLEKDTSKTINKIINDTTTWYSVPIENYVLDNSKIKTEDENDDFHEESHSRCSDSEINEEPDDEILPDKKPEKNVKLEKTSKPTMKIKLEKKENRKRKNTNNKKHELRKEICPFCGKFFLKLQYHITTHTGEANFPCNDCSRSFFTPSGLQRHLKVEHSGSNRKYKCDKCVADFFSQTDLITHMLKHTNEKAYVCEICNKTFKRHSSKLRHQKRHDLVNKNIKCQECPMMFFSNSAMRHHLRVHTRERPYNCEICCQPYSYKHDFNRHCFKKHGIFMKHRKISIMNEEVLKRERSLMKNLTLKAQGVEDALNSSTFQGPLGALALDAALKVLQTNGSLDNEII